LRPPEGHAVVFFGAKAEIMTNGVAKSFHHGSVVNSKEKRRAMVQFIHADVGMKVVTAEDTLREFRSEQ
jgi:isopenicillin N synthase-like dioxygenase